MKEQKTFLECVPTLFQQELWNKGGWPWPDSITINWGFWYTDMKKIPGWTKLGENIIDVSPF